MKKIIGFILALICLFSFTGVAFGAMKLPDAPTGSARFVLDDGNLINPQDRQTIINISNQLYEKTKTEIVVVTVPNLQDQAIFDYAQALFRKWGIGDKEKNNGILILINRESVMNNKPGKVRIHVGYGAEGALNDAKAGRIIDQYMLPKFQSGNYSQGILDGYTAVAGVMAGEYNLKLNIGTQNQPQSQGAGNIVKTPKWAALVGVIIIISLLIIDNTFLGGFFTGLILGILFSGGFRGGGGGWGGGGFGGGGGGFGGGDSGGGGADR